MKRFLTYLVVAVLLISAVSTSVSAANYTDTEFMFFSINADGFTMLDEIRQKEDSSSVYVNFYTNVNPTYAMRVSTYGCSNTVTAGPNLTVSYGNLVNSVICLKGVEYGIHNWIYEREYPYATFGMKSLQGNDKVCGLWSPDSVGDLVIAH